MTATEPDDVSASSLKRISRLEEAIGYVFQNKALALLSLTHSSSNNLSF